jgi:FemAB-related protein (PEP-CTERM system-associated)
MLETQSTLESFIDRQAKDTFYYQKAWLDLITGLYGYSLIPLTAIDAAGRITGYLPVCLMHSPLTGRRLVSLPFSDLCPLLAEDESSAGELIDQALGLARQEKARYLELRAGAHAAFAHCPDLVEANLYVRWLLPLAPDPEAIWSQLRKPVQHQVKKSQKLGVHIRVAQNRSDVAHYYRLHLQTRCKKHGMPAQPQRYFYELWDRFAGSGGMHLLLAEYQETIIAGMILLTSGATMRYAYGASREQYLRFAPNNLLMWSAISLGCSLGCRTFDLGRTACDNEGLMEFKRRWGAIKEPIPYYYYPATSGLAATSEASWKYRLLTSFWKRLPLSVAASLGGHLYKHLG